MVFNIRTLKSDVVAVIKDHLLPEEQSGTTAFDINKATKYDILQSFIPYSTAYRDNGTSFSVEFSMSKVGTPSGSIMVYLLSDDDGTPSSTITGRTLPVTSVGTITSDVSFYMDMADVQGHFIGSKTRYYVKLMTDASADNDNYYTVYRNTIDTSYMMGTGYSKISTVSVWSTLAADMNFRVSLPTWIYPDYPFSTLKDYSYPRVAIDVVGRTRTDRRWIDKRLADYYLNIGITIYSKYTTELDDLVSYIDRSIWYERCDIAGVRKVIPGNISNIATPKPGLFVRTLLYEFVIREKAEDIT